MPLLAGIGPLGVPELLIIAFIVLLVFGVGRLPEVGGAIGKSMKEFRKATKDDDQADGGVSVASAGASGTMPVSMPHTDASSATVASSASADKMTAPVAPESPSASAAADAIFCNECGARNLRSAKFCAECGKPIAAPVS